MSHEYRECNGCHRPVKEHLMNHTERGSYCDACYKRLGLKLTDEELGFKTCSICGRKYLQRNFSSELPDDVCSETCAEKKKVVELKKQRELVASRERDIPFDSEENQKRDIILGFIHDETGKRVGMRILHRVNNTVETLALVDELCTWNLNIHESKFYPKCCKLTEFPVLTLPKGVVGNPLDSEVKLVSHVSGAWVVEELANKIYRLVSVSGQMKDVAESTAINFHTNYKLANATLVDGKLEGMYKKYIPDGQGDCKGDSVDDKVCLKATETSIRPLNATCEDLYLKNKIEVMKALNEELKEASAAYYGDGESKLTDLEYDAKYDSLCELEIETGVILPDSVTQNVGTEVKGKLKKVEHAERLLSLDKTKDVDVLKSLLAQGSGNEQGVLSWKMDGLTVYAYYVNGVLKQAVTRGNGKVGEDVTHNAKFFKHLPRRIPYKGELKVRGEAVLSFETFDKINASLPEGQDLYKNCRNLASGLTRRLEVTKDGSVEFIGFEVVVADAKFRPRTYAQSLTFLKGQGFKTVDHVICTLEQIPSKVEEFKKRVADFEYPTDGLVLRIDANAVFESLGNTTHHPKGAMAFKWADEQKDTILREVEWSASRTGVLTPVAIFDAIELEGTTVSRASVHNLTQVRKYKLGIGDTLRIYKANMIIPQIAENKTGSDTVQAPKSCPICKGVTGIRNDGTADFVVCLNPDCMAKNEGKLTHFVKREAMNIDGVSEKTIHDLVSNGFIGKRADFYSLKNHPEIAQLTGWGVTSYNKLLYAIENSRTPRLANFIHALGIRNVGKATSDILADSFGSLEVLLDATAEQISQVEGIGSGMTADIVDYITKNKDEIQELAELLTIVNPGQEATTNTKLPVGVQQGLPHCLDNLTFCVTGKVDFPGARAALGDYIKSLGGHLTSAVSKNTDYLITNTPNSGSTKNKKAQELGCKVISEQAFYLLVKDLSDVMGVNIGTVETPQEVKKIDV